MKRRLWKREEAERGTPRNPYVEKRLEWPEPRPQPEREPSHPGAREEDRRDADT